LRSHTDKEFYPAQLGNDNLKKGVSLELCWEYSTSRTVSYLVAEFYILFGVDDNLLLAVDGDDLGRAIGIT
jgi:hypothetical protein